MAASRDRRWLSISEAGRVLGMSRATLLAAEEAGLVAPIRTPGGHRRYRLDDLRRYADQPESPQGIRPVAAAPDDAALPASVRAAVRPLVHALDGHSAGLYLLREGTLRFCAAFGIPRWLAERLAQAPAPAVVARAVDGRRARLFDPESAGFPESRTRGHGLAVALRHDDHAVGALFLIMPPERELLGGDLRVVEAFRELITTVVVDRQRISDLEGRLERIAGLSAR